ncbi:MAG: adenosylcobinamide-phosphate synthase CbiB [Nitrospinota bacterium]
MVLAFAFFLDVIFGDPRWFPHPVRGIGALTNFLEARLYKLPCPKKISGTLLTCIVVPLTYLVTLLTIQVSELVHPVFGFPVSALLLFTSLSTKSLYKESMQVFYSLRCKDIEGARKDIAMIVGRDTKDLSEREVVRASVETVAENIVDGIIAPVFWWVAGGVPLAMAYKAANTLDSMVGYKSERYKDFGWASARFDDLVNFIPARLSIPVITLGVFITGKEWKNALRTGIRDGGKNPSPNAGIPEALVAGALQVELGGVNYYGGKRCMKEKIGQKIFPLSMGHIKEVNRVMLASASVTVLFGVSVSLFFENLNRFWGV